MRTLTIIFLLLFFIDASAQTTANIYWTTDTELKAKDVIYYNPNTPLTWENFVGIPKPSGQTVALTASGFGYKASASSGSSGKELNIGVYCYFSKPDSWVKPGNESEYVLSHEQHHFDITYIIAKSFLEKLKKEKITLQNMNVVISRIYKDCNAELTTFQDQYDNATKHGLDKEAQAWWHNRILAMFK